MRIFIPAVLALILSTSWQQAHAQDVCLDGDTVIGIKGLDVATEQYGFTTIDVDFRYATGHEVYGSDLEGLPFDPPHTETDPFSVLVSINQALSAHSTVPGSAGQPGQITYYIGAEEETDEGLGAIAAFGGANYTGQEWQPCKEEGVDNCFLGVAILQPDERFTYADLSRAVDGASCDSSAPPPDSFTITPGITGSWYDPERDGEGYNIEIVGSSLDPQLLAYFYTYDGGGNQMWLVGAGPVNGDTAVVPVQVTSGPVFGDDYDKDDVIREDWGTLTFKFSSCTAGSVMYNSNMGFGSGTVNFIRLTYVTGLTCP